MDQIISLIRQFIDLFRIWIIVCPWEQAVRVRIGKYVTVLNAGIHFRIPLMDTVFLQSTRMRVTQTDRQTITCADGKTVTITAAVGYSIADVQALYNTLHHAEDTIRQLVRAAIAEVMASMKSADMDHATLTKVISARVNLSGFGISEATVYLNEFAISRTYRLIGDYAASYAQGTPLSTEKQNTAP